MAVTGHDACETLVAHLLARPDLVDELPDWTVWCTDMDLLRVARSPLPLPTRLRVLPARTERGLGMLGSKTGLANLLADLAIPQPDFVVARTPEELTGAVRALGAPLVVKGERGAGGRRVLLVTDPADPSKWSAPEAWYPLLVQRLAPGPSHGADALFAHGRLVGLLHSRPVASQSGFGPTTVRHFCDPDSDAIQASLSILAEAAGLHGFANCTFVRDGTRDLLIEVDMRPNAWHQFGPRLGVQWPAIVADPPDRPVIPRLGPSGRVVHLYPRELVHGLRARSWSALRPWLVRAEGTWPDRVHGDPALDRAERDEVRAEVARLPRRLARRVRRSL